MEKVGINPASPLQKFTVFENFPYSHSLILGNVWSLLVGLVLAGLLGNPLVVPIFVCGSASQWILDTVVHLKEMRVLGFNGDTKVDAGLWRRSRLAFVVEYGFYTIVSAFALSGSSLVLALIIGGVFHGINAPSILGSSRKNSVKSSKAYAGLALFGFGAFTLVASLVV